MAQERYRHEAHPKALEFFHPKKFGFSQYGNGWCKEIPQMGEMAIVPLSWEHIHTPTRNKKGDAITALEFVSKLQQGVFGLKPLDTISPIDLAVIQEAGGSVLVAYDPSNGLTPEGWLGFGIVFGSPTGTATLHMIGVREDRRGIADIGWYVSILHGHEALKAGHEKLAWTFDPMRGSNARLNLEKLGGEVNEFTIDKYGNVQTTLYGPVPSDRFKLFWDLLSPQTHARIDRVRSGNYHYLDHDDIARIPVATSENVEDLAAGQQTSLAYEIPGDIDTLMQTDQAKAIAWRQDLRSVMSILLDTTAVDNSTRLDPAMIKVNRHQGLYHIKGFATSIDNGQRRSFYLLERKPST